MKKVTEEKILEINKRMKKACDSDMTHTKKVSEN